MPSTAPRLTLHKPDTLATTLPQAPPTTMTTSLSKSKSKSKRHSYISPNEIDRLSTTLFNTNFKPPRRPRIPKPPSLRGSLLPPPCAEIDERPRWRIRRLVLWRDRVPPLRLAVLDPRKRAHLKRFQGFVTPEDPEFFRGVRSVSGVLRSPTGPITQPHSYIATPKSITAIAVNQMTRQQSQSQSQSQSITPYPSPPPSPAPDSQARLVHRIPSQISSASTLESHPIPTPTLSVSVVLGRVKPPRVKSTILSRRLARARTLQHSLILHREEERRWRSAMGLLMTDMQDFVRSSTCVLSGGKKIAWIRPIHIPQLEQYIKLMIDIRASSKNLWSHIPTFIPHLSYPHRIPSSVKGLKEAKAKVKGLKAREERKRQKKEARRLARIQVGGSAGVGVGVGAAVAGGSALALGTEQSHSRSDVKLAIRARATPVTVISHRQRPPTPNPDSAVPRTPLAAGTPIARLPSAPLPQSPQSDRIITPPTSHRHASPEWTKLHPDPTLAGSGSPSSTRSIRTPRINLTDLGDEDVMPDEIARQLAEMLTTYKRLHTREQRRIGEQAQSDRSDVCSNQLVRTHDPDEASELAPNPDVELDADVPDLEVSVYTDDSDGSELEGFDGMEECGMSQSIEAGSYATAELNMDDDTKAAFSGISIDTFVSH